MGARQGTSQGGAAAAESAGRPAGGAKAGAEGQVGDLAYLDQGRNEQMYSQRPDETAMVKPLLAGTSK